MMLTFGMAADTKGFGHPILIIANRLIAITTADGFAVVANFL